MPIDKRTKQFAIQIVKLYRYLVEERHENVTFTFYFQVMNAARQISRQIGRATEARSCSAADYSITATLSVVPAPLETAKLLDGYIGYKTNKNRWVDYLNKRTAPIVKC